VRGGEAPHSSSSWLGSRAWPEVLVTSCPIGSNRASSLGICFVPVAFSIRLTVLPQWHPSPLAPAQVTCPGRHPIRRRCPGSGVVPSSARSSLPTPSMGLASQCLPGPSCGSPQNLDSFATSDGFALQTAASIVSCAPSEGRARVHVQAVLNLVRKLARELLNQAEFFSKCP